MQWFLESSLAGVRQSHPKDQGEEYYHFDCRCLILLYG